ncbi:MAG: glycosyl transferase [Citrobacter freundii]|nr:MAG: glycosyl transferase [Citrobacter freundii]
MQYYCTLFNSIYLSRGLAMYRSLEQHAKDFHLYIFAFDNDCYDTLQQMRLAHATIISLKEFESEELLAVKPSRTAGEYCWTCTSSTIWYCLHTFSLDHCTYIDADLLFFSDPKVLLDEMGDDAVLITEHRYSPQHDQCALSGIYCVQFVTFKNNPEGLRALDWWRRECIKWCYRRFEDGKFGDQKYLDDWTERFRGVHVLQHHGGGVAPWNNLEYDYERRKDGVQINYKGRPYSLVFYHFHDFKYCEQDVVRLTSHQYALKKKAIELIYQLYERALQAAKNEVRLHIGPVTVHEKPEDLSWINGNTGRKLTFALRGFYKNYYRRSRLG